MIKTFEWLVKCNCDGAAKSSPGQAVGGGIFRDSRGAFLGWFSTYFNSTTSLHAKFCASMIGIEIAFRNGWNFLWQECDSKLVVDAFSSHYQVPWWLRNRWKNCLYYCSQMKVRVSHIYREGNSCADKLPNFGIVSRNYIWWDNLPVLVSEDFFQDRQSLPSY